MQLLHSTQLGPAFAAFRSRTLRFPNKRHCLCYTSMGNRHGQCLDVKKVVLARTGHMNRQTFWSDSVQCSDRPAPHREIAV